MHSLGWTEGGDGTFILLLVVAMGVSFFLRIILGQSKDSLSKEQLDSNEHNAGESFAYFLYSIPVGCVLMITFGVLGAGSGNVALLWLTIAAFFIVRCGWFFSGY